MWVLVFSMFYLDSVEVYPIKSFQTYNECFQARKANMIHIKPKFESLNCLMVNKHLRRK